MPGKLHLLVRMVFQDEVPIYYEDLQQSMGNGVPTRRLSQGYSQLTWKKYGDWMLPVKIKCASGLKVANYELLADLDWAIADSVGETWFDVETVGEIAIPAKF